MAAARTGLDYADLAIQAHAIDNELNTLLEELLAALNSSPAPSAVEAEAERLAHASAHLAQELQTNDMSKLEHTAERIDLLAKSTDSLLMRLPDAIIAAEHGHWSAEMESIRAQVRDVLLKLDELSMPHLKAERRTAHEKHVRKHLHEAKSRLHAVRQAVHHRAHVPAHPMYQHLHLLRNAVHSARTNLNTRWQEHISQARVQALREAYHEMREFFSRQMSGRIYVDGHSLQLRSDLTGRLAQWEMDEPHSWALKQVLGEEAGSALIDRIHAPGRSFAAHFEVSEFGGHPILTFDGGERTIMGDRISYQPFKIAGPL